MSACKFYRIYPVRYALSSAHDARKPVISYPGAPDVAPYLYTLRTLREGWVHVLSAGSKKFFSARIKLDRFTDLTPGDGHEASDFGDIAPEGGWIRIAKQEPLIYVAYSDEIWTPGIRAECLKEPEKRMRLFDLSQSGKEHGRLIEELTSVVEEFREDPGWLYSLRGFAEYREFFDTEKEYHTPPPAAEVTGEIDREMEARWEESAEYIVWQGEEAGRRKIEGMSAGCAKEEALLLPVHDTLGIIMDLAAMHAAAEKALADRAAWYAYAAEAAAMVEQSLQKESRAIELLSGYKAYEDHSDLNREGTRVLVRSTSPEEAPYSRRFMAENEGVAQFLRPGLEKLAALWELWITLECEEDRPDYLGLMQELDPSDAPSDIHRKTRETCAARCHVSLGSHAGKERILNWYLPEKGKESERPQHREIFLAALQGNGVRGGFLPFESSALTLVTVVLPAVKFRTEQEVPLRETATLDFILGVLAPRLGVPDSGGDGLDSLGVFLHAVHHDFQYDFTGAPVRNTDIPGSINSLLGAGANWGSFALDIVDDEDLKNLFPKISDRMASFLKVPGEVFSFWGAKVKIVFLRLRNLCFYSSAASAACLTITSGSKAAMGANAMACFGILLHCTTVRETCHRFILAGHSALASSSVTKPLAGGLAKLVARGLKGGMVMGHVITIPTAIGRILEVVDYWKEEETSAVLFTLVTGLPGVIILCWPGGLMLTLLGLGLTAVYLVFIDDFRHGEEARWAKRCLWGVMYKGCLTAGNSSLGRRKAAYEAMLALQAGKDHDDPNKEPGRSVRVNPPPLTLGMLQGGQYPEFSYTRRHTQRDPVMEEEFAKVTADYLRRTNPPHIVAHWLERNKQLYLYVGLFAPTFIPGVSKPHINGKVWTMAPRVGSLLYDPVPINVNWADQRIFLHGEQAASSVGLVWDCIYDLQALVDSVAGTYSNEEALQIEEIKRIIQRLERRDDGDALNAGLRILNRGDVPPSTLPWSNKWVLIRELEHRLHELKSFRETSKHVARAFCFQFWGSLDYNSGLNLPAVGNRSSLSRLSESEAVLRQAAGGHGYTGFVYSPADKGGTNAPMPEYVKERVDTLIPGISSNMDERGRPLIAYAGRLGVIT